MLARTRPSTKQTEPSKPTLWARDNHGQYTTRGQNSVATVRGTEWETIESCAGTTTYVKRGVVAVKNLHTGHTVLVHAGHRYLAGADPPEGLPCAACDLPLRRPWGFCLSRACRSAWA